MEYQRKDSVIYNTFYRDTIIYIPESIASIDGVLVNVDTSGLAQLKPIEIKNNRSSIKVAIKDSKLVAESKCSEDSLRLLLREKEVYINNLERFNKETTKVGKGPKQSKLENIFKYIGAMFIGFVLGRLYKIFSR